LKFDRSINITITVIYLVAQQFKGMFFSENACRMDVFDAKNNLKCNVNSLHELGENKVKK